DPELGGPEIKILSPVITVRECRINNEADGWIELRGEGFIRCRELWLDVAQYLLPHLLLELFAVTCSGWCRHRGRCRWWLRAEFLERFLLLPDLFLHLPQLFFHDPEFALQLFGRRRYLGKCVCREQTHRTTNERLYGTPHAFLPCDY